MKYEGTYEEIGSIISAMTDKYSNRQWDDSGQNLIIKNSKGAEIGKLNTSSDDSMSIVASGNATFLKFFKSLTAKLKNPEALKVSQEDLNDSIFSIRNNELSKINSLANNKLLFKKFCTSLKRAGILNVKIDKIDNDLDLLQEVPTLYIPDFNNSSSRFYENINGIDTTRFRKKIFETYSDRQESEDCIETLNKKLKIDEEAIDIKLGSIDIGIYYKNNNIILLHFNILSLFEVFMLEETLPKNLMKVFKVLRDLNIEMADVETQKRKMFIKSFMVNIEDQRRNKAEDVKRLTRDIEEYEQRFVSMYTQRDTEQKILEHLTKLANGDDDGEAIFSELEATKKLKFIKDVRTESNKIVFEFIPTCLQFPYIDRDGGRFTKRSVYIGSITFKVTPQEFRVEGPFKFSGGHCHSHGGSSGTPCFGDSGTEGRKKIMELLSANKFCDLAKMLWIWIKTHKDGGAHVRAYSMYDSALRQGIPVFDEKGVRIKVNDKKRIESGEQRELELADNYQENIKKYADVKFC